MEKLYIVIPAYNEEMNITSVAREWHTVVETISEDSKLVIIDDGSKDSTYQVLTELSKELPQLEVITKKNSGHGATVLYGYRYALEQNADILSPIVLEQKIGKNGCFQGKKISGTKILPFAPP